MEYYFETSLGLLIIASRNDLPTAVDLRIGGNPLASYLSAEMAAKAVASQTTGNPQLDSLPLSCLPKELSDWCQTRPHYFSTQTGSAILPKKLLKKTARTAETKLESHLAI